MKATKTLVLTLLLILGLGGLALGRDRSDRNGLTPAASYAKNPNAHRGRHHRGRHNRGRHNRHRGRRGRRHHGGMNM